MPSSFLSHQAPALYIKAKYPKKIDGTAICLATIVPDFSLFLDLFTDGFFRNISHSFMGIFIWTLPLTLLSTIIFSRYIGPFLARIVKWDVFLFSPLRYFGVDLWDRLKFKRFNKQFFIVASYSAVIGGLTHILLDFPAHENIELFYPFVLFKVPEFMRIVLIDYGTIQIGTRVRELTLTVYTLIWIIETLVLIIPTLYYLRKLKKDNVMNNRENLKTKNLRIN
ncbi:MAG: DUF4184 family protein [Promethearchaeota archaeon]|nr:MAG: DUF4184 family protein [Candidatus Lokiarchaeota archaeon]